MPALFAACVLTYHVRVPFHYTLFPPNPFGWCLGLVLGLGLGLGLDVRYTPDPPARKHRYRNVLLVEKNNCSWRILFRDGTLLRLMRGGPILLLKSAIEACAEAQLSRRRFQRFWRCQRRNGFKKTVSTTVQGNGCNHSSGNGFNHRSGDDCNHSSTKRF